MVQVNVCRWMRNDYRSMVKIPEYGQFMTREAYECLCLERGYTRPFFPRANAYYKIANWFSSERMRVELRRLSRRLGRDVSAAELGWSV